MSFLQRMKGWVGMEVMTPQEQRFASYEFADLLRAKREAFREAGGVFEEGISPLVQIGLTDDELKRMQHWAKWEDDRPMISIVIPSFNTWALHTKKLLESLRMNTAFNHAVILVDNGSNDGTPAKAREFWGSKPGLTILENKKNVGFAAACNQGAERALGRALCFLNSDCVLTEGWDKGLWSVLNIPSEAERGVGVVGPMTNFAKGKQRDPIAKYIDAQGLHRFAMATRAKYGEQFWTVDFLSGFCFFVATRCFDHVGGFDEQFFPGNFEDDDFCKRALIGGYELRVARGTYIHHEGGASFIANGIDYNASMRSSGEKFRKKWAAVGEAIRFPWDKGNEGEEAVKEAQGEVTVVPAAKPEAGVSVDES